MLAVNDFRGICDALSGGGGLKWNGAEMKEVDCYGYHLDRSLLNMIV